MKTKYRKMFKGTVGSLLVFVCLIGMIVGIINGIQITQTNEISAKGIVVDTIINIVLGIISAILSLLFIIIKPLVQVAIICLQNAIYVLTIYPLGANIFTGDYGVFLASIASLFIFFMIVFLILSGWKRSHSYQKESFDGINLAKAVMTLVLMPIILMLVMALGQLIAYGIFGMNNIYDVSIYQLIEDATLNNANIDGGEGVLTNYSEEFFKMFLFIVAGGFTIYFLFGFAISLGTRLFELIAFGIAGVVVASSSQVYDEGERFSLGSSIMLQKILIPIISIIGYLVYLMLLPELIKAINDISGKVFVLGLEGESKAMITVCLVVGGGMLIKSLSTEGAFLIAGQNGKAAFATQINSVMGDLMMPMRSGKRMVARNLNRGTKAVEKTSNKLKINRQSVATQKLQSRLKDEKEKRSNYNNSLRNQNLKKKRNDLLRYKTDFDNNKALNDGKDRKLRKDKK